MKCKTAGAAGFVFNIGCRIGPERKPVAADDRNLRRTVRLEIGIYDREAVDARSGFKGEVGY